jgi:hypothetical protein
LGQKKVIFNKQFQQRHYIKNWHLFSGMTVDKVSLAEIDMPPKNLFEKCC